MKIPLYINDVSVVLDTAPDVLLNTVLRENSILSPKKGCEKGFCGLCTVLIDNKPVPSCIVPIASVRGCRIVTLEHFRKTDDYKDIEKAFKTAKLELCGYCNAAKIFAAYEVICKYPYPTYEKIYSYVTHFKCNCCETESLIKAIGMASVFRTRRLQESK